MAQKWGGGPIVRRAIPVSLVQREMPGGIKTMHIHPPKPLHGWKEFLNEIFVIVIGVLIALGFEQVVEELHWQHKVHEGEERLKEELGTDYNAAILQMILTPCNMARLKAMEQRVLGSGATLVPTPLLALTPREAVIGRPGKVINLGVVRPSSDTYTALGADGTLLHFEKDRQHRLAAAYSQILQLNALTETYRDLDVLASPIPLDPSTRLELLRDIKSMQRTMELRGTYAANLASHIRELRFAHSDSEVDHFLRNLKSFPLDQCVKERLPLGDWRAMMKLAPSFKSIGI